MIRILLICGSGASSGFMAARVRKAAAEIGEECEVLARSDSELNEYIANVDVIMLGSHYEYMLPDIQKKAEPYGVKADVIKANDYGMLNGKAVLKHALALLKGE